MANPPPGYLISMNQVWGIDGSGPYVIGPDGQVALASPGRQLYTDYGGPNSRLRVDVGQTGFFAGREFRTYKEFYVASSTQILPGVTYVIKAVVPINIILASLEVALDNGFLRMRTFAGGTEGGSFSETLPIFPKNNMSERPTPFYTPQVILTAGGTHNAAGTLLDVVRLKVQNNANSSATAAVAGSDADSRGVSVGTYYFLLTNIGGVDPLEGTFHARWEERP